MIKLIRYLKGYIPQTILAPLCKVIEAAFELIVPLIVAFVIDDIIPLGDTSEVWRYCIILLALGVGGLAFSCTCQYVAAKTSHFFGANIRINLYKHINTFSHAEIDKFGAESLNTRLTNDVNNIQVGLALFMRLVTRSPFIVIGATIMSFMISPMLSIIFLAASILISFVLYMIMTRSSKFYTRIQRGLDGIGLQVSENLTGTRVVRAFSRQNQEKRDFANSTNNLSKTAKKAGILSSLTSPLTYVIINVAIILVLYFGGVSVNIGGLEQGQVLALTNYLTQMFLSLIVLALLVTSITRAEASAKRVNEVFETQTSITFPDTAPLEKIEGDSKIKFENVNFCYPSGSGNSLENINIDIKSGQTIGIIGSTGSGKTTIANLISRFYDIGDGSVTIDGHAINKYPRAQLFEKIALVPQKSVLFYGSIRDNMHWGDEEATDEEIWDVLEIAQGAEIVRNMTEGLDTMVMAGGKNLSGGQRQRLTIARALIKKSEIIILDDSSSALDYATDAALRKALKTKLKGTTVIMISQRANSIKNADQILVLDDGKQVGLGRHNELLKTCDVYKEIVGSQENAENNENKKAAEKVKTATDLNQSQNKKDVKNSPKNSAEVNDNE